MKRKVGYSLFAVLLLCMTYLTVIGQDVISNNLCLWAFKARVIGIYMYSEQNALSGCYFLRPGATAELPFSPKTIYSRGNLRVWFCTKNDGCFGVRNMGEHFSLEGEYQIVSATVFRDMN